MMRRPGHRRVDNDGVIRSGSRAKPIDASSFFLHQPDDPLPAHALVLLGQILVNARLP